MRHDRQGITSARRTGWPMAASMGAPRSQASMAAAAILPERIASTAVRGPCCAVAAGEDARHVGHQRLRVRDDEAARRSRPRCPRESSGRCPGRWRGSRGRLRASAGGSASNFGSNLPSASLTCSQNWKVTSPSSSMRSGPQPGCSCTPSATASSISCGLAGMSRRFSSESQVDVLRALPQRRQGDVDGDVAAADDDDPRPDPHRLAAAHGAQEVDAAEHEGLMDAVDRDAGATAACRGRGTRRRSPCGRPRGCRPRRRCGSGCPAPGSGRSPGRAGRAAGGRPECRSAASRRPSPAPRRSRPRGRRCAGSRPP